MNASSMNGVKAKGFADVTVTIARSTDVTFVIRGVVKQLVMDAKLLD